VKTKLTGAEVRRAGKTARYWSSDKGTDEVYIKNDRPGEGVRNAFTLDSKGGGQIEIEYIYKTKNYKSHLRAMIANDRQAALVAMCEVLREELATLNDREGASEAKGAKSVRRKILEGADSRWAQAPSGSRRERDATIVRAGVRTLISQTR
jgi:hypothetical protein